MQWKWYSCWLLCLLCTDSWCQRVCSFPPAVGKIKRRRREGSSHISVQTSLSPLEAQIQTSALKCGFPVRALLALRRSVPLVPPGGERMSGLKLEDEARLVLLPSVTACCWWRGVCFQLQLQDHQLSAVWLEVRAHCRHEYCGTNQVLTRAATRDHH